MKIDWKQVREIAIGVAAAFFVVEGVKFALTKLSQMAQSIPSPGGSTASSEDKA